MQSIDYYIEQSKLMDNSSDGGSPAYHFDDVVLVKYTNMLKYGVARPKEEQVASVANQKNEEGVRTPRHIVVKREVENDKSICWVLQERAKGESFVNYGQKCFKNPNEQLRRQYILACAPSSHYEQFISDICSLFNMGLELKSKNIYYDKDLKNGGFTIIDLLNGDGTPINYNSLEELLEMCSYAQSIANQSSIAYYDDSASNEQKETSEKLRFKISLRLLEAMQNVIPTFAKYKRWILRTYPKKMLEFFVTNGFEVGDLKLTSAERNDFAKMIDDLVDNCLRGVANGQFKYWQITANEVGNGLIRWGLDESWRYNSDNQLSCDDFEEKYSYECACNDELNDLTLMKFEEKLSSLKDSENPYILQAITDMNERKKRNKF